MHELRKLKVRVKRKIRNTIRQVIPHNSFYRPTGVYTSSKNYAVASKDSAFRYIEIYPNCISSLQVDKELFDNLSPHHIHDELAKDAERTFIATFDYCVVVIPQGRLFTNNIDTIAYVTKDNQLLEDVSYQFAGDQTSKKNKILQTSYFDKPAKYNGVVFSMVAGWSATWNYSHWLLDALPRIHLLKKSGWFDQVNWFVVPAYKYDYQKDSLELLGIGKEKIIIANEFTHLTADTLITSAHPRGKRSYISPTWISEFLRDSYLPLIQSDTTYPPYIYISRRDASYRRVLNEKELIPLLEGYGFKDHELADLPFIEKIKLFATAKFIISINGAGLNNLTFCQPGTKVIEFFAEGFVHTIFYDLAKKAGLDYHPIVYKTNSAATSQIEGMLENITVDLQQIQAMLDTFFKSQENASPIV